MPRTTDTSVLAYIAGLHKRFADQVPHMHPKMCQSHMMTCYGLCRRTSWDCAGARKPRC